MAAPPLGPTRAEDAALIWVAPPPPSRGGRDRAAAAAAAAREPSMTVGREKSSAEAGVGPGRMAARAASAATAWGETRWGLAAAAAAAAAASAAARPGMEARRAAVSS